MESNLQAGLKMKNILQLSALTTAIALAGCGGGGGFYGPNATVVPTPGATTPVATNYHIVLSSSKPTLVVTGDTAVVTARLLDANGGGVAGQKVVLSIPATLSNGVTITGPAVVETDANGNATFTIDLPSGGSNAALISSGITVNATFTDTTNKVTSQTTMIGVVQSQPVSAAQFQLSMSGSKSSLAVTGDTAIITVKTLDANGGGVAGQSVVLALPSAAVAEGVTINGPSTVVSDVNGNAVFTINLAAATGSNASALIASGVVLNASLTIGNSAPIKQVLKLQVQAASATATSLFHLVMNTSKSTIVAGNDTAVVTVKALDVNGGGAAGQTVVLSIPSSATNGVTINGSSSGITDTSGNVSFTIQSQTNNGAVNIPALIASGVILNATTTNPATNTTTTQSTLLNAVTTLTPAATIPLYHLAMATSKAAMVITGDTATVTVKTLDVNGGSVGGQNVTLQIPNTATSGVIINGPSTVKSNANGDAVFTVVLPTATVNSPNPQSLLTTGIIFNATVVDANNLSSTQSTMVNVIAAPVQVAAQFHLVMSSSKSSILVTGDTVSITTKLVDANGGGVAGQNVVLNIPNSVANGITIAGSSTGISDVNGNVTFNLVSNSVGLTPAQVAAFIAAGSFQVNSTFTDVNNVTVSQSTTVGVSVSSAATALYHLSMATSKPSLVVTGDSATVVVKALNVNNAAVAGQNVTLVIPNAAALGITLTSTATTQTDANGNAIFTFALAAGTTANTSQLLAGGVVLQASTTDANGVTSNQSTTENVVTAALSTLPIYQLIETSNKSTMIVTGDTAIITTQLVDANGGGVAGQIVKLMLPPAVISNGVTINGPSTAVTDVNGYATFTVKLANVSSQATLVSSGIKPVVSYTDANNNSITQNTFINVAQAAASAYHLTMTSSSTTMVVTGGVATVTVKALDNNAGGVAGQTITLSIPSSAVNGMTINGPSTVVTDATGNAVFTVTLPDDTSNAATVIASGVDLKASITDANNVTSQQTTHINVIAAPLVTSATYRIDLTSNVPTVLLSGGQVVVTTKLVDANGGGVANQQVVLSIPGTATNGVTIIGPSTATTDANGNITYTLNVPAQSSTTGISVNATYTATNGTPITQSTNINVATTLASTPLYHLAMATSASSLNSSGDIATITVKALDVNNGGVAGRSVSLNIPNSSGLTVNGASTAVTDVNGNAVFTVNLAAGSSNPTGIDVTASITDANNNTAQQMTHFNVVAPVSTTYQVVLSGNKSSLLVTGDTATMTVKLLDLNGGGVVGQNVSLSLPAAAVTAGVTITGPSTVVTDVNGNAVFTVQLAAASGANAISLLANGVTVTASYAAIAGQPATTTQITKLNVVQASANSKYHLTMASNKTALLVTGDSATVTVTALDVNGGGVQGQNVVLSLPVSTLNQGAIISGSSTGVTDLFGNAVFTVTIPAANPTNNPQVDTVSLLANGITVNASLTDVTGATTQQVTHINGVNATNPQPIGQITVGQSNKISASSDDVYYNLPMSVNVVGIDGKPVANQSVTMTIAQLEYYKGFATYVAPGPWAPVHSVTCTPSGTPFLPISFTGPTISSTPTTATYVTDSTGKFDFSLRYAKNYAGWLDVAMTATATVSGTTITSLPSFSPLPLLASEVNDVTITPPNQFSPYNPLPNDPNKVALMTSCP
jgi:predicted small lipoprotein YifL